MKFTFHLHTSITLMDFQVIQGSRRKHSGTIKWIMQEENSMKILFTKRQPRLRKIYERWSSAARVSKENVEGFRKELLLQPGERASCDFKNFFIKYS